jgi:hypothetical protein
MGLPGGFTDDRRRCTVELYELFRRDDPEDPAWRWPEKVVPICHWGCAIYSCIDCSTDDGKIIIWDPNTVEHGTAPLQSMRDGHPTVKAWFESWALGENIWNQMFPSAEESA